ncbi:hypothetical protein IKD49_00140 [Candidatus Saccharibacteria bacterium]|nr:hypothetical protein [Candidatus Saccharibacteria bacterium]
MKAFRKNLDLGKNGIAIGEDLYTIELTEEQIRQEAINFYEEYFKLHDVYLIS